ncbi:MAG: cupredoxin domain-containing protein [Candidatus Nealsonbacteria bacterium]|nr:cupredoxin domain-containing protein [Candidatus Nealsonbacteria bacterium]
MKKIILFFVIIASVVGIYFIFKGGQNKNPTSERGISTKEFTITAKEFSLSPSAISAKKGEQIKITFKNDGTMPHNFTLNGLGINTNTINSGETDVLEFMAPPAGTYDFFCSIPGHKQSGMAGTLKVE